MKITNAYTVQKVNKQTTLRIAVIVKKKKTSFVFVNENVCQS